ncbi:hypothetical protein J1N35_005202 [Gossypium stocksii]|uniref:Uncharacterized protein n=1 Tax=Gossypium stocksii TaxID=47602 RepID=A0A9D4AGW1_9ROSI|nr:hypothetical protein J1N35_005202 [Gossypium stocksii]
MEEPKTFDNYYKILQPTQCNKLHIGEVLKKRQTPLISSINYVKGLQIKNGKIIKMTMTISSDYSHEFENEELSNLCDDERIRHEFCAPKTPHQSEVVEMQEFHQTGDDLNHAK